MMTAIKTVIDPGWGIIILLISLIILIWKIIITGGI